MHSVQDTGDGNDVIRSYSCHLDSQGHVVVHGNHKALRCGSNFDSKATYAQQIRNMQGLPGLLPSIKVCPQRHGSTHNPNMHYSPLPTAMLV